MKIIQVITELSPAGAERVVANLSKELQKRGHDVVVISLQKLPTVSTIVDELQILEIPIETLNMMRFSFWRMFKLRCRLREIQPDIVHAHLIHPNIISRLGLKNKPFKLINTVHIAEKRKGKAWHFWLDRVTISYCDHQTCVSKAVREFHAEKIGVPINSMSVIYNGIDSPKQLTNQEQQCLRHEWGLERCERVIGSVGRLDYQKGYDIFLRKLANIADKIPMKELWGIVIIGEGPMRKELENLSNKVVGSHIKVCLPGFRPDAARCMNAFDLFIMPSRYEGFGLTLIEAMACGIPILASNVDSLPELLAYYENGECLDFDLNSDLSIYKKICALSRKSIKVPYLGFTIGKMVDEYERLYTKELLEKVAPAKLR